MLIKRQQDLSELISALLSFFISGSFYCPSNGLFITFILYKPAPVWPHYDYSSALEFQDNYELHCFNKSLGQPGSLLHLHSSQRDMYESSTSAGQMESDALQVNIYTLLCEGGYLNLINCLVKVVWCGVNLYGCTSPVLISLWCNFSSSGISEIKAPHEVTCGNRWVRLGQSWSES